MRGVSNYQVGVNLPRNVVILISSAASVGRPLDTLLERYTMRGSSRVGGTTKHQKGSDTSCYHLASPQNGEIIGIFLIFIFLHLRFSSYSSASQGIRLPSAKISPSISIFSPHPLFGFLLPFHTGLISDQHINTLIYTT